VKHPPPWLFVLTGLPYGVVGQFVGVVMPYATDSAGIDMSSIGLYSALLFIPTVVQFLYSPIIDVGPRRKHWLVGVSVIGAVCLMLGCMMPLPEHTHAFLGFAFVSQLISGLVGSCNGGLMAASMPDELRGKAAGWYNIGNISGGGLAATIAIAMIGHHAPRWMIGGTLGVMMIVPSLAALTIDEPLRESRPLGELMRENLHATRRVLFSKAGATGMALCMSPVGTAALANSFAAMSKPYGVSPDAVALSTGLGSVILTAIGAGICGYLCDRFNRRVMYLISGGMTAVCGLVMALSPRVELTYIAGVLVYALITGFCYSAFTSTVLETIGKGDKAAASKYSMYIAGGNLAILYVGLINTRFEARHGVEGVIGSDAALNIIGVVVLALAFWRLGSFGKWKHPVEPVTAPEPPEPPEPVLPTAIARIVATVIERIVTDDDDAS
jgi:MFS family permease